MTNQILSNLYRILSIPSLSPTLVLPLSDLDVTLKSSRDVLIQTPISIRQAVRFRKRRHGSLPWRFSLGSATFLKSNIRFTGCTVKEPPSVQIIFAGLDPISLVGDSSRNSLFRFSCSLLSTLLASTQAGPEFRLTSSIDRFVIVFNLVDAGVLGRICLGASGWSFLSACLNVLDGGESKVGREGVEPGMVIPSSFLQIPRPRFRYWINSDFLWWYFSDQSK
jgi:hypothetical protein